MLTKDEKLTVSYYLASHDRLRGYLWYFVPFLVPPDLMNEFRTLASDRQKLPRSWIGAMFVATLWIVAMSALVWFLWGFGSQ